MKSLNYLVVYNMYHPLWNGNEILDSNFVIFLDFIQVCVLMHLHIKWLLLLIYVFVFIDSELANLSWMLNNPAAQEHISPHNCVSCIWPWLCATGYHSQLWQSHNILCLWIFFFQFIENKWTCLMYFIFKTSIKLWIYLC